MAAKLDFERWMQGLGVLMGEAMRATGPIMESRLSERGVSWTELDESQVIALFVSAFREHNSYLSSSGYRGAQPSLGSDAREYRNGNDGDGRQ